MQDIILTANGTHVISDSVDKSNLCFNEMLAVPRDPAKEMTLTVEYNNNQLFDYMNELEEIRKRILKIAYGMETCMTLSDIPDGDIKETEPKEKKRVTIKLKYDRNNLKDSARILSMISVQISQICTELEEGFSISK